jgi:hypothetical protein
MIDPTFIHRAFEAMYPDTIHTLSAGEDGVTIVREDGATVDVDAIVAAAEVLEAAGPTAAELLRASDSIMDRLTEDVLDNLINGTPIPQAAIDKLAEKKAARNA